MQMKMSGGMIYIRDPDMREKEIIKSWRMVTWDKKNKWWAGFASRGLLNRLRKLTILPAPIEMERRRLNAIQDAVDAERTLPAEQLKPLAVYPVKKRLYAHQVRAANMALLVFGAVSPQEDGYGKEAEKSPGT